MMLGMVQKVLLTLLAVHNWEERLVEGIPTCFGASTAKILLNVHMSIFDIWASPQPGKEIRSDTGERIRLVFTT